MTRIRPRWRFALPVLTLASVLACIAAPATATAAPPYLKFLEGLRERGYEDMALAYLDQLEADASVPQDVKDVIDYERAVTLIRMSRSGSDPGTRSKRLDEASAALDKFIAAHGDHPLAARAQTDRGGILLGQAQVAILEANAPGNEARAETFRQEARQALAKAREIFDAARQRYEQQWKSYGPFTEDEATREARDAALSALVQTRLQLAECTYREAQSYPQGDAKRIELLNTAAGQYEAIHSDYRTNTGGLYARLWMAKCYEEQAPRPDAEQELTAATAKDARQKLSIAEAIYSELLEHDTRGNRSAAQAQELAFWWKLIVRNHPVLADHVLVVDLATEWLKTRTGPAAQAPIALGVRWERGQAYEKVALRRDTTEAERTRNLRAALSDAEFVNAFSTDYRDVSRAMIQRVKAALGRGQRDPQDFDEANGLATTLHRQIGEKRDAVKAAKTPAEKAEAEQALAAHLDETARMLRLALDLAEPSTDRTVLNGTRFRLAYVEYNRKRPFDAAALGEYIARKFKDESPQIALDSAYLAMAAYDMLFDSVPDGQSKEFELERLRETADFIATSFPDSEQANEARMMVGRLSLEERDYATAAEWFSKVPESSTQGLDARLLAGRSFWDAYAVALASPEEERPDQATLEKLQADAQRFLREGLAIAERRQSPEQVPSERVVAAKVTLAQIVNLEGKYQEAVDLLTGGPQPVVKLVAVDDPKKRPKTGVTSAAFASIVHQQLLRAYIGLQQIEPAIVEMRTLEQIGGEGNTAVFVQLGRQIKSELEGLEAGPQRDAVMGAFDQFLGNVARMQQGQTYGSLVWIGETYFGLAEAAAEPKRSTYFDRAAASYQTILNRSQEQGFLPTTDAEVGVKLRLATVEKSRGEFTKAYSLVKEVLKAAPKALNAQVEAATILADWGRSGQPEAPNKLLLAIQGDNSDAAVPVWGWGQIAQRLQRALELGQSTEEFLELYRRARYEIPAVRRAYANTRSDRKQFDAEVGKAERELLAYVATTPREEIGDAWWSKLDGLYADIQRDQGVAVIKRLVPATEFVSTTTAPDPERTTPVVEGPQTDVPATQAGERPSGGSVLPILVGLVLAGGVTAGLVITSLKSSKKRRPVAARRPLTEPIAPAAENARESRPTAASPVAAKTATTSKTRTPRTASTPGTASAPRRAGSEQPAAPKEQPLTPKKVRRTKPGE